MSNSFSYKDLNVKVGDTISFDYTIKEGNKERKQAFRGVLIKITGNEKDNKSITVRKITKSSIGVERIIPLTSPFISNMKVIKKGDYSKAKAYFIRNLSEQELRKKIYRQKGK